MCVCLLKRIGVANGKELGMSEQRMLDQKDSRFTSGRACEIR